MENWKAIIYLLAAGQGFMLSLSLIVRGLKRQPASLFFGLILCVFAMEILNAWGMQVHYHSNPDSIPFWNLQSYLLLPISLFFFVHLTTRPGIELKKRYWLSFLPVLIEISIRCGWQIYQRRINQNLPSLIENPVWFSLTEILPIIGMVVVLCLYGYKLNSMHKAWQNQSLSLSFKQHLKLYGLFAFLSILTLLWIAGVVFKWAVFGGVEAMLSACLFGLGYAAYLDPDFFNLPSLSKPVRRPEFAQYDNNTQLERLQAAFRTDTLHTQSKLTLEDVAAKLHLPPRYVSYLINTYCDTNFNNFVNGFRVEEVIRKLEDPAQQHKTVLALAMEAGFNSKSTFNQVFKQHTRKSPSEFLAVQK